MRGVTTSTQSRRPASDTCSGSTPGRPASCCAPGPATTKSGDGARRSSAGSSAKEDTVPALLYDCLAPSLGHGELFVQKAIGWALRAFAHTDPGAVRRDVAGNGPRLSKLARREALKKIDTQTPGRQ